ncbi:MAG: hypothetical protein AAFX78_19845 [Cyanobacteria bacterium J06638_20]
MARNSATELAEFANNIQDLAEDIGNIAAQTPGFSAYGRAFCRVAAGTPFGSALEASGVRNSCTPFWADEGITPPTFTPPFPGGQCMNQQYTANVVSFTYDLNGVETTEGPFGAGIGPGPLSFESGEGFQRIRAAVGGVLANVDITNIPGAENLRNVQFNVVTTDGAPDDCGSLPDVFNPSPDAPGNDFGEEQEVTGPDGRDYRVTPFEPSFDIDGNFEAPFNIDDVEFDFGGGGSPEGPPEIPSLSAGTPVVGTGDEGQRNVPLPPPGFITVALKVAISGFDLSQTGVVRGSSPNARFYAPQGNADIVVASEDNTISYVRDLVLMSRENLLTAPIDGLRIVAFRVNTVPGVSYTVTPILRMIPIEE